MSEPRVDTGELPRPRVMAVASGGGHWQQLMILSPAFAEADVLYVTTLKGLAENFEVSPAVLVTECNRHEKRKVLRCARDLWRELRRFRPDVVVTTGALPGVIALGLAKLLKVRTVWVDSVANAEEMSLSGKLARRVADHWYSQWEHVAEATGARYAGSIL